MVISKDAKEIAMSKVDNSLLDDMIQWGLEEVMEEGGYENHLLLSLIEAKQYRNLELEYL